MPGFAILLLFNFLGLVLEKLGLPLPAGVTGLILFTTALFLRLVKVEWVEQASSFLLRHLLMFFIPAVAAIVDYGDRLGTEWKPIAVGLTASTVLSAVVAGHVTSALTTELKASDAPH